MCELKKNIGYYLFIYLKIENKNWKKDLNKHSRDLYFVKL